LAKVTNGQKKEKEKEKEKERKQYNILSIHFFYFTLYFKVLYMKKQEPLQQLNDIRNMMERSSRFISLSGLSGVSAGIVALTGAAFAFFYLDFDQRYFDINRYFSEMTYVRLSHSWVFIMVDAVIVLALALFSGIFLQQGKPEGMG